MPSTKTILCYGDSNTWGYVPAGNGARHPLPLRWASVLATELAGAAHVIPEGLNGRTAANTDPLSPPGVDRNGLRTIGTILDSHRPLDVVVIFLGTNDLKPRFGMPPADIATGVEFLVGAARNPYFGPGGGHAAKVLVICPPPIIEVPENHGPTFAGGREKSLFLRPAFRQMAARAGVPVLYAEDYAASDPADGIHLSVDGHAALGHGVAGAVRELL